MRAHLAIPLVALACLGCITDAWTPPVARTDGGPGDAAQADAPSPDAAVDAAVTRCDDPALRALSCGYHSFCCAARCDGSVWCWGSNTHGQLGDGTTTTRPVPARLTGLPRPATALGSGYQTACAVLDDGSVWCWGRGGEGGLGAPGTTESAVPVRVSGLTEPAVSVAVGGLHLCAVLESGALVCWGENSRGQIALEGGSPRYVATRVTALKGEVAEVTAGQYHTCARSRDGTVSCWGQNTYGTLADGLFANRSTPAVVPLRTRAVSLATQANHVCAGLDDESVWCWGYNSDGQLGNGARANSPRPVAASMLQGTTTDLVTGDNHSCALADDGALRCWGGNEFQQLGDGTTTRRLRPGDPVALEGPVMRVSAGRGFTCAEVRGGRVLCWGDNTYGSLGDGTTQSSATPVTVALP
jgi:alpha-tubulin suppressor-like RCC1 family protein